MIKLVNRVFFTIPDDEIPKDDYAYIWGSVLEYCHAYIAEYLLLLDVLFPIDYNDYGDDDPQTEYLKEILSKEAIFQELIAQYQMDFSTGRTGNELLYENLKHSKLELGVMEPTKGFESHRSATSHMAKHYKVIQKKEVRGTQAEHNILSTNNRILVGWTKKRRLSSPFFVTSCFYNNARKSDMRHTLQQITLSEETTDADISNAIQGFYEDNNRIIRWNRIKPIIAKYFKDDERLLKLSIWIHEWAVRCKITSLTKKTWNTMLIYYTIQKDVLLNKNICLYQLFLDFLHFYVFFDNLKKTNKIKIQIKDKDTVETRDELTGALFVKDPCSNNNLTKGLDDKTWVEIVKCMKNTLMMFRKECHRREGKEKNKTTLEYAEFLLKNCGPEPPRP